MRKGLGVITVTILVLVTVVFPCRADSLATYQQKLAAVALGEFDGVTSTVRYINTPERVHSIADASATDTSLLNRYGSALLGAATFTVNYTTDQSDLAPGNGVCDFSILPGNQCTFRAAIEEANATAGLDIINFNIGTELKTITPASGLPTITDPVIIDGTTNPGFAGTPIISLNGASAGIVNGLTIGPGGCTVRGLVINRFSRLGIEILTNGGNVIEGNFIGTDSTGTVNLGNVISGVNIDDSPNNTIGGTTAAARNVISGNGYGVSIWGSSATGNQVLGNFIGTDVSGTVDLGNSVYGVLIIYGSSNIIGGTTAGARNVISGNGIGGQGENGDGVHFSNSGATGNQVLGNFIGTDVTGSVDLGNSFEGVSITNSSNNTIGGTTAAARNVISGNHGDGVLISGSNATGNQVLGNFIGTDVSGTVGLGIFVPGVLINDSPNNTIGGTTAAARNVISGNDYGVIISGSSATGNEISFNSIFSNFRLGIDLLRDGLVMPNDSGDLDDGPNHLQNFPVLSQAFSQTTTTIVGKLNSYANAPFTLEFFSNDSCDPSGYGEGQTYIGSDTVTTDGSGNANINVTFPIAIPTGKFITATATDSAGNTSEFCQCETVVACAAAKGDMNASGGFSPADAVSMLNCVFMASGNCALCFADVNCDGNLTAADVVSELNLVFLGTPPMGCP